MFAGLIAMSSFDIFNNHNNAKCFKLYWPSSRPTSTIIMTSISAKSKPNATKDILSGVNVDSLSSEQTLDVDLLAF